MTANRTLSVPVVFALITGVGLAAVAIAALFLISIRNPEPPPVPRTPPATRPGPPEPIQAPKRAVPVPLLHIPPAPIPAPVANPVRVSRLETAPIPKVPSRYKVGNAVEQDVLFTRRSAYHVQGIEVSQAAEYSVTSDLVVNEVLPDGGCSLTQTIRSTRMGHCDPSLRQDMLAALEKTHGIRFEITVGPDGDVREFKGAKDAVNLQVPNDPGRTATFRLWSLLDEGAWKELAGLTLLRPPAGDAWERPISHNWGPLGAWTGRTTFRPNGSQMGQSRIDFAHALNYRPPAADAGGELPLKVVRAEFRNPQATGSVLFDANLGRVTRAEETFQVRGRVIVSAITSEAAIDLEERQDFQLVVREPKERDLRAVPAR